MKRKIIFALTTLVATIGLIAFISSRPESLLAAAKWAESAPELAWPLFFIIFFLAVVLMLPGWVLMVVGGYLFGMAMGGILVFIANLAGSIAAFFLAQTLARQWVEEKISKSHRFRGFDAAVKRNGFYAILLARLALLPNNLLNYACGLTAMRLRDFVLGTALGCLPIVVANVLIGASTLDLFTTMGNGELQAQSFPVKLIGLTIAGLVLILILAKRMARRFMSDNPDTTPEVD